MLFYKNSRKKVEDYGMDSENACPNNQIEKNDLIYCEPFRKKHVDGYCYIIDINERTGELRCKDRLGVKRKINIKKDKIKFVRHGVYYGPLTQDSFNRLRKFGNTIIAYDTYCYYNCDVDAVAKEFEKSGFHVKVKVCVSVYLDDYPEEKRWMMNDAILFEPTILITLCKSHDKHIL